MIPPDAPRPPAPSLGLYDITVDVADGRHPRRVLDRVTLEVRPGEMVAVMGPSGAGKSTIVEVACGLVAPTSGRVVVDGDEPGAARTAWWSRRRRTAVGVVHQRLNLLGGLTASDNVALAVTLAGRERRARAALALAALERAGAGHLARTRAEQLSVGEQQRVAIARAIAGDQRLVLADEPAAALDRTAADQTTQLLAELAREGRAVLLVTHDSQQASWADRTVVLRDGRIVDHVVAPPRAVAP